MDGGSRLDRRSSLKQGLLGSHEADGDVDERLYEMSAAAEAERDAMSHRGAPLSERIQGFFGFYWRSTLFFVLASIYVLGISWGIKSMNPEIGDDKIRFTWESYFSIEMSETDLEAGIVNGELPCQFA